MQIHSRVKLNNLNKCMSPSYMVKREFANIQQMKRERENWGWLYKISLLLLNHNKLNGFSDTDAFQKD